MKSIKIPEAEVFTRSKELEVDYDEVVEMILKEKGLNPDYYDIEESPSEYAFIATLRKVESV